ncbi:DNA cytosine methyltransferase [Ensifer adhaerens]|uniref:DNA cytosine methyltransferase n=1 Tax=Ensifer adhaerens TaxID=106592 RepID=UPI001C4E02BA|nr:DNA cytosine methyltransferase [Ensifer adhaerens]MBW0366143.1 DNA cytosine methyltransferase [Ensifer adhaerens]UCM19962.1 DNA cytosine methyltransferase [Ensifer adhaerens]
MNLIDLFCGCGGFSKGAQAVGFKTSLAVDVDPILTSSVGFNHPETLLKLGDISQLSGSFIREQISGAIDVVIGGPPCQGFSAIGHRKVDDPRRTLVGHYYRLVAEVQPKLFVMENVEGLGFADAKATLEKALEVLPSRYRIVGPMVLDAADFGAATRRRRLFVIGYDPDYVDTLSENDFVTVRMRPATVAQAIADLRGAIELEGQDGFDRWQIQDAGSASEYARSLHDDAREFTGNQRTVHKPEVVERFRGVPQGGKDLVGRYPRLAWQGQCPTLRAGTGSDRGSFQAVRPLHPEEPRVITVREAARLQGFPDGFRFHPTIWHSFRMIGNSVSPVIAREILGIIATRLGVQEEKRVAAE